MSMHDNKVAASTAAGSEAAAPPLVSVIIPVFNAKTTLQRALQSVSNQSYRPIEVIVVDDGSVDGSAEEARSFRGTGITVKVIVLEQNQGAASARNHGIRQAAGDYIAFLDADDEWKPEKLAIQMDILQADRSIAFVYTEAEFIARDGTSLGLINQGRARPSGPQAWKQLLVEASATTPTVLVTRKALERAGLFNPRLEIGEDQDLWIRLALTGPVAYVEQSLARVFDHADSLSNLNRVKARITTMPMILEHVKALGDLLEKNEINRILASRYASVARQLYDAGEWKEALDHYWHAVTRGFSFLGSLSHIVSASPPVRFAKRFIRHPQRWTRDTKYALIPKSTQPMLTVVIDTEEEFEWSRPFDDKSRGVEAIKAIPALQGLFEKYGVIPTYVVDYMIADSEPAAMLFRRLVEQKKAVVGAHLHPWVNPPIEEDEEIRNTYPGNLPFSLEFRKLERLTGIIAERIGKRPDIYKAGRYGFGQHTTKILETLGYSIDVSILPSTSLGEDGGPDFTNYTSSPFWMGSLNRIFEIPMTRGFSGMLRSIGPALSPLVYHPLSVKLRLAGILARTGLLERGTLTPEGMLLEEKKRLIQAMLSDGARVFSLTLHSSTLLPSSQNRYVKEAADLQEFLDRIEGFLKFFRDECNGRFATPYEIRDACSGGAVLDSLASQSGAGVRSRMQYPDTSPV